jgi:ankyrin repeat protein
VDLFTSWKFRKYIDFDYIVRSKDIKKEMCIAIHDGSLEIVEYLFEKHDMTFENNDRFLYVAIRTGNLDIVEYIFEKCNREYFFQYQNSLLEDILYDAISYGHLAVVKFLNEIAINCGTEDLCLAIQRGYSDIVQYIIENHSAIFFRDSKEEILEEANYCGDLIIINMLNKFFKDCFYLLIILTFGPINV